MSVRARFWVAAFLSVLALVVWNGTASAAPQPTPSFATDCSADLDVGTCERLDYLATSGVNTYTSDDDSHRLDLIWWGMWALVGVELLHLVAPAWWRAWGYEGKLGRG